MKQISYRDPLTYIKFCLIVHLVIFVNKGNSSIPLFKTRKSMDKKQNRSNKLKLRETH